MSEAIQEYSDKLSGHYPKMLDRPVSAQQNCISNMHGIVNAFKADGSFKAKLNATGPTLARNLFTDDREDEAMKYISYGQCFKKIPTVEELS